MADRAEVLACPIPDMGLPSGGPDEMARILDNLDGALTAGGKAYVHCWGGLGRTGTVVGCWLARHGYGTGYDALRLFGQPAERRPRCWSQGVSADSRQMAMVCEWEEGR
ncbi:MAG: hypothetical protein CM1200mP26_23430 [Acidimicrobiales bacterium]|nr:MAG: hypothetical protein CM1200mP26_23430 [Acidimicrobiales bacterium]